MSDTVKLIIEIPKEAYNVLLTEQVLPPHIDVEWLLIHGTPLDDVIGKIESALSELGTKANEAIKPYVELAHSVSAENKGEWIPVSERLPRIADVYRVTRYYPNNVMNPIYLVDACCFDGFDTWYDDNRINHERAYADNVIAWQENPEPYKKGGEEE